MKLIQKITLLLANRYLKTHHYRVEGSSGNVVFATGDILLSPRALVIFKKINSSDSFEFRLEKVEILKGQFRGLKPTDKIILKK